MTQEVLVLGGGPIGFELAAELSARDQPVVLVDREPTATRAREAGLTAHESTLETATSAVDSSASTVVVATPSDARNLLLAAAAPGAFDADRVVALVNDPGSKGAFDDAGIETICLSRAVARVLTDSVAPEASRAGDRPTDSGRAAGTHDRARAED